MIKQPSEELELCLPQPVQERRAHPERRKLQQLAKIQHIKGKIDSVGLFIWQNWTGRVCFLLFIAICTITLCWSYFYRLALLEQTSVSIEQRQSLKSGLEDIQLTWSSEQYQHLHEQVDLLYQHIIPGYPELAVWLGHYTDKADEMGLQLSYSMGDARVVTSIDNVIEVPVSITLKRQSLRADKGYISIITFLHMLLQEKWRLDFESIRMESNGNGVESVKTRINLWIRSNTASQIMKNDKNTDIIE